MAKKQQSAVGMKRVKWGNSFRLGCMYIQHQGNHKGLDHDGWWLHAGWKVWLSAGHEKSTTGHAHVGCPFILAGHILAAGAASTVLLVPNPTRVAVGDTVIWVPPQRCFSGATRCTHLGSVGLAPEQGLGASWSDCFRFGQLMMVSRVNQK